jgi:hypothetical protein
VTDYAAKKSGAGEKEPARSESAPQTEGASESKAVPVAETKTEPAAKSITGAEETKRKKTSRPATTSNGSKSD